MTEWMSSKKRNHKDVNLSQLMMRKKPILLMSVQFNIWNETRDFLSCVLKYIYYYLLFIILLLFIINYLLFTI